MKKEFTKADLKDGMVVEYVDGRRRLVIGDTLYGTDGCLETDRYNENLEIKGIGKDLTIQKIMYWRTCDTSGMARKEVQRINELRKAYELKDDASVQAKVTLAQRNQADRIAHQVG